MHVNLKLKVSYLSMVEIIIQIERLAFGLTIDADKSDIHRWRACLPAGRGQCKA
jgi:hypothetical protein